MKGPYRWQQECLDSWIKNGRMGIIEASTGSGKTRLAICCMRNMLQHRPDTDFMITVPTLSLVSQWRRVLVESGFSCDDIGERHSQGRYSDKCRILIYVINTARYEMSKEILARQARGRHIMLIADEYHHMVSKENSLAFEFMQSPRFRKDMYSALGLSATADGIHADDNIVPYLGPMIYRYTMSEAVQDRVVSPYAMFSIGISFNMFEAEKYDKLSLDILAVSKTLQKRHPYIMLDNRLSIKDKLKAIRKLSPEDAKIAIKLENLIRKRRFLIVNAEQRTDTVMELMHEISEERTVIIFTERIDQCRRVASALSSEGFIGIGIYHSRMDKEQKRHCLSDFRDGWIRILVCCKALDEGIDVPRADVGIFLSNSDSMRQRIQRAGRLLRRADGKEMADLYYVYVRNTIESPVMLDSAESGVDPIFIRYTRPGFENDRYNRLVYELLSSSDNEAVRENSDALYNLAVKGALSHDWLLDEGTLRKKAEKGRAAYYALMIRLSRLRAEEEDE